MKFVVGKLSHKKVSQHSPSVYTQFTKDRYLRCASSSKSIPTQLLEHFLNYQFLGAFSTTFSFSAPKIHFVVKKLVSF